MSDDLVTQLLPTLSRSSEVGFNVFDVMRHGTHEKQISNAFRWLLDADGSHGLGEAFAEIFIAEVNRHLAGSQPLDPGGYWVRQEVNIAEERGGVDIADLVLESKSATLVIENYITSDGHGHGYDDYLRYSRRRGGRGAVVMLCHEVDRSRLTNDWDNAVVVTYRSVLEKLRALVDVDRKYRLDFAEPYSFIDQMHRKFVKGRGPVEDQQVLDFVIGMCETGEATRYSKNNIDQVAEQFGADMQEQARERFGEGRVLLQTVKDRLKAFSREVLKPQLNAVTLAKPVGRVAANYVGKWRWEVILDLEATNGKEDNIQLIFGPSAWHTQHESAPDPVADPNYRHIFIWRHGTKQFLQSTVTLQEVLAGIDREDTRLRDEILVLLGAQPLLPEG